MTRIVHNKEAVFRSEALPHLDALYRVACRILNGNKDEAEDLVQEVFAHAWSSFESYEPGTNCKAWLFAILYNKSRHVLRRMGNRKVIAATDHGDVDIVENVPAAPPVPDTLTDEQVLEAIDSLRPQFRDVLLLSDVEEFAYGDISEILEIPIGTVMSRLYRARVVLRENLYDVAREYGVTVNSSRISNG